MFRIEMQDSALRSHIKALDAAISTNQVTEQRLRSLIRKVVNDARRAVERAAMASIDNDPRHAAKSVRRVVYKKILGANINIYSARKASDPTTYEPPKTLQSGQWGGNRVPRSATTQRYMSYGAKDRGFILRFLNSGANGRVAGTRGGKLHGNRGSIAARDFFSGSAETALTQAAERLANLIEQEINKALNDPQNPTP